MKEWLKFVTQEVLGAYQIDLCRRVDLALREIGSQLTAMLIYLCLCGLPGCDWASGTGGAPQAGIVVLWLALDTLADHYEKSKRIGQSVVNAREVTALKK